MGQRVSANSSTTYRPNSLSEKPPRAVSVGISTSGLLLQQTSNTLKSVSPTSSRTPTDFTVAGLLAQASRARHTAGSVFDPRPIALALLLTTGCGSDEFFEPPPPAPAQLTRDNMYTLDVLPEFRLELNEQAKRALESEPKSYVAGTFSHGARSIDNVGIRLKGNDTLTPLSEKPSFKIKFNAFVPGQRFLGFEGLTLNNMHSDASMVREWLGYMTFREAGVPAPRTGYALVRVNDEEYGLYLNIEPYNDDYLERVFDDPTGNLYEAEHGVDVQYADATWDQDEGEDDSGADLGRLAEVVTRPNDDVFYGSETRVDRPAFLGFVAAEAFMGHFDGYQGPHNFFVYNEPSRDIWWFLPWNLDQTFARVTSAFAGDGYLTRKCLDQSKHCLLDYIEHAQSTARALREADFGAELDAIERHIGFAARGDRRKRHTNDAMAAARERTRDWVLSRTASFAEEVDCLVDGEELDEDADGFGTCYHDCDDNDANIHFGATEACDDIDNDCNGFVDDIPECPCPSETLGGDEFFFCSHVLTWVRARDFCEAQGHQLAKLANAKQNSEVWEIARHIAGGLWAIGLNDRETEDEYRWLDGSESEFTSWAEGEPAKRLPIFDCAFYNGQKEPVWLEGNCNEKARFICSGS